jgi:hypothetical protein
MLEALVNRDEQAMLKVVDEHLASVESHIFGERLDLPPFDMSDPVESSPNPGQLLTAEPLEPMAKS